MTDKKHDQPLSQPDPETTHTTDPQEHMEGPISSFMQNVKENAEGKDKKTDRHAHDQDPVDPDTSDRDPGERP